MKDALDHLTGRAVVTTAHSTGGDAALQHGSTTIDVRRLLGLITRLVLFSALSWHLYSIRFVPFRNLPFDDAETEAAVRAINAGHPFELLDIGPDGKPQGLRKMSDAPLDRGMQVVMAIGAAAGRRIFGSSFQLTASHGREMFLVLFVITTVAVVAPPVPLLVAVGGALSIRSLFEWGPFGLGPAQHWGVAYAVVTTSIYLATVLRRWTGPRRLGLLLLAVLAAFAQVLRQESVGVAYLAGLSLMISGALCVLVGRRASAPADAALDLRVVARRAVVGGLLLVAINGSVRPLQRWFISSALGTPFTETRPAEHGVGAPLYLGLGYVSNPFNIGWRDPIAILHARLATLPQAYPGDAAAQEILRNEFLRIVTMEPWLLVRNIAAKAVRVHLLASRQIPTESDIALWQLPGQARFYRAAPWVILISLLVLMWRGTPEGVVFWVASLALVIGGSAGALLAFPEYLGGTQGVSVVMVLVVSTAIAESTARAWRNAGDGRHLAARQLLGAHALIAGLCLTLALALVGIQALRYRALRETTAQSDPLAAIKDREFRYAYVFNDLSVGQQGRLVARLHDSTDASVAHLVDDRHGDSSLFRPELIVRTDSQLHLIAWMGRSFHPPVPRLYQGTTHALVLICGDCPSGATLNDFPFDWMMINDLEWRDRYRMVSLPVSPRLKAARYFQVVGERVARLDPSLMTGLIPELIGSARVGF
jgi:hypothetical protein